MSGRVTHLFVQKKRRNIEKKKETTIQNVCTFHIYILLFNLVGWLTLSLVLSLASS